MDFEIKDGCLVKYTGEDKNVIVPELCFGETKVVDQSCRL